MKKLLFPVFVVLFLAPNLIVSAVEFDSGDTLNINKESTNLHVAGSNITVNSKINKDLVAASGNLSVLGNTVGRNMNLAGGTINVNDVNVFGTSRIAGGQIQITGNFNEDLLIFGGQVNIVDAKIAGDLVIYAGDVTVEGATTVDGKLYGGWDEYKGLEPSTFVAGEIMIDQGKDVDVKVDADQISNGFGVLSFILSIYKEITSIIGLILILIILGRRNRTHIPSVKADSNAAIDFAIGALSGILVPVIAGLIMVFFFPAIFPLLMIFIGLLILSSLFMPVYVGNMLKNTFNIEMKTRNVIIITYIAFLFINMLSAIPFIGFIFNLLIFVLATMNFGFILKKIRLAFSLLLLPRKSEE